MKLKVKVVQSCPNLCNAVDCSLPGSSVHGILQKLYWSWQLFPYPRDLPNPGIQSASPALADEFFTTEPHGKPKRNLYRESKEGGNSFWVHSSWNINRTG